MKKDFFSKYLSEDSSYHIVENEITKEIQGERETVFTLGNGFLGSRGVFEENPAGSAQGTFIAGMYDMSVAQVEELVNLPNPINFIVSVEGEKFDIFTMKVLSHKRILDMKNGSLIRKTVFRDAKKRKYLYQSIRFFSMDNPHVCVMKISLKLLKGSGKASLAIVGRIDDSVYNAGGLMLARKRHFNILKADKEEAFDYMAFRTNYFKHIIAYADAFIVEQNKKKTAHMDRFFQFELRPGQEISITKYFAIYTSYNYSSKSIKRETMRTLNDAVDKGCNTLYKEHIKALSNRWYYSDVSIKGDEDVQRAVRFNIYHMLISARKEYAHFSIGAKTLSGEGYRGHIFWDTEMYLLPFYIYTYPEIAHSLLMFRYNTLDQARNIATEKGYKGAMFPWEATVSGTEQTPRYSKDMYGNILEVQTQDYEHHITADVAYGTYNYYRITGDKQFMKKCGIEMIFETARFWASRVCYNKKDKKYHINNVIGPDEFHIDVNDNAYTNYLAGWNLKYAVELYEEFKNDVTVKKLLGRIKLTKNEIKTWQKISDEIVLLRSKKKKIINQFDGYLRKQDRVIDTYDYNFLPVTPKHFEYTEVERTSLIKQPDVLALFFLFPEDFTFEEKRLNYEYYIKRTTHKSSLSYCMHAVLANDAGDFFRSFCYFWMAINTDLIDVPNNTVDGIHAANLGGVWQALIMGYAGVKCYGNDIRIMPKLPGNFESLKFKYFNKGDLFEVEEASDYIKLRFIPKRSNSTDTRELWVMGKKIKLLPFKYKTVKLDKLMASEIVTAQDVIKKKNSVTINEDTYIRQVSSILLNGEVTGAPVVDNKNKLKGMISEKNIRQSTYKNRFGNLKAMDIMETNVVSVKYKDPIETVAKIFMQYPYRRLPVIRNNKVVGVITRKDIVSEFLVHSKQKKKIKTRQ